MSKESDCLSAVLLSHYEAMSSSPSVILKEFFSFFFSLQKKKLFHFAKEAEMLTELLLFFSPVLFGIVVISLERNDISSSRADSQDCAEEVTPLLLFGWR